MAKTLHEGERRRASRVIACYELAEGIRLDEAKFTLTLSLPGREGTVAYSFGRAGMPLDAVTYRNLIDTLEAWAQQAISCCGGIQEVMPLAE